MAARIRRVICRLVPAGLLALWLLGMVLRVFVQDRLSGAMAYYYYATPPVVLGGLATAAGLWWLVPRHWKPGLPALGLGVACLVWAYRTTWYHNPPAPPLEAGAKVLFWNAARGVCGWSHVVNEIRQHDADIVGLVEAERDVAKMKAFWQQNLPEYRSAVFDTGITLLAKCEITQHSATGMESLGRYAHCELHVEGRALHVVVADITGNPSVSRRVSLDPLYRLLRPLVGQPVLVIGDFSTPPESVFLQSLRRHYINAFEFAGNGWAATWPAPLPVLTLDQAWFGGGVQVGRCELGWSWVSDHRPLVLEVSVLP